jgi:Cys-tRNA synthase (O-phospho-L-seryl-tRNA:Cys-tRNA synthase)
MTKDDIIRLAREADFEVLGTELAFENFYCTKELFHFAELVAAEEREACAKVCEQLETGLPEYYAQTLARAIRARGLSEN